jgi:hypothetical protein
MSKDNYIIRSYEKGDEESINNVFNEVFYTKRSIQDWYWKFNHEDYGSLIMIAVDQSNKILAHFASTFADMNIRGKVYNCGQGVDVFSNRQSGSVQHRAFIKTGQEFLNTYGHRDKIIDLSAGFPSSRALRLEKLKFNYCEGVPVIVGKNEVKNKKLLFKKNPVNNTSGLDAVQYLWNRSSSRYPVSIVRNARYIQRRYIDRPSNNYFYLSVEDGGEIKVFSVLSYEKHTIKWVDLIWDGADTKDLIKMDEQVQEVSRLAGVGSIEIWIHNDPGAKDILIDRGYEFSPHGDLFYTALSFHPDIDADKFVSEVYFTLGDSDLV